MDGYLGEIKMFAGTFAPLNWVFCWGQSLSVSQYSALYALISNQFGGNATNFNVPDLRGRVPIGAGAGPGLTPRTQAQMGGLENVTLNISNLPLHTHTVKCDIASAPPQQVNTPVNNLPSVISNGTGYAPGTTNNSSMKADMLSNTGSSQPHDNMPPWGCLNYILCVEGMWPPKD